jgi:hypothetical protein
VPREIFILLGVPRAKKVWETLPYTVRTSYRSDRSWRPHVQCSQTVPIAICVGFKFCRTNVWEWSLTLISVQEFHRFTRKLESRWSNPSLTNLPKVFTNKAQIQKTNLCQDWVITLDSQILLARSIVFPDQLDFQLCHSIKILVYKLSVGSFLITLP